MSIHLFSFLIPFLPVGLSLTPTLDIVIVSTGRFMFMSLYCILFLWKYVTIGFFVVRATAGRLEPH
jgi:hypothetical protein